MRGFLHDVRVSRKDWCLSSCSGTQTDSEANILLFGIKMNILVYTTLEMNSSTAQKTLVPWCSYSLSSFHRKMRKKLGMHE